MRNHERIGEKFLRPYFPRKAKFSNLELQLQFMISCEYERDKRTFSNNENG